MFSSYQASIRDITKNICGELLISICCPDLIGDISKILGCTEFLCNSQQHPVLFLNILHIFPPCLIGLLNTLDISITLDQVAPNTILGLDGIKSKSVLLLLGVTIDTRHA